jgi:hypothetical protein
MTDVATAQTRLAEIEAMLADGTTRQGIDGRFVERDLAALERERDRLQRIVAASTHSSFRRVVFRNA